MATTSFLAYLSADLDILWAAMIRGACEYQGQEVLRRFGAYVARSPWRKLKDQLVPRAREPVGSHEGGSASGRDGKMEP